MGTIEQALELDLDRSKKGTVFLHCQYSLPDSVRELKVRYPGEMRHTELHGFSQAGNGGYQWDGGTNQPYLVFEMQANRASGAGYEFVDQGDWAIIQCPRFSASWRYVGDEVEFRKAISIGTEGAASSDGSIVYLGPYEEHRRTQSQQSFRLIVPEKAELRDPPDRILSALTHAADYLRVGGRNETVIAVAAPSEVEWRWGGLKGGENGFWVQDNYSVDYAGNPWVHEYVHTRQAWERAPSTDWLVEGTTEYYAALCTYRRGEISFSAFHDHVMTDKHADAVLADPDSWSAENAIYTKGRRVVAALDCEIRDRTDDEASFQDVFSRMNDRTDQPLTHQRFVEIVDEVAGASLRSWLSEYVRGPAAPTISSDPSSFGAAPDSTAPETEETSPPPTSGEEPGASDGESDACSVCGSPVAADDEFCSTCGAAVAPRCPNCGRGGGGDTDCPECGATIVEKCSICGTRRLGSDPFCAECGFEFGSQ